MDRTLCSLMAGAAGAGALTLSHQAARRATPSAPRMDVLGMRAVRGARSRLGLEGRSDRDIERQALAGDLVANSFYYSGVMASTRAATWQRGFLLGALAGVGALILPERMGLGTPPHIESSRNKILTVAWYLIGGLTAAAAANAMRPTGSR